MTQSADPTAAQAKPNVSPAMVQKLAAVNDYPLLDSEFIPLDQFIDSEGHITPAEKTLGTQGWYISSPADNPPWSLRGPFA